MKSRTVVGICALVALLGVAIYLLVQIPWEFGVFGVLALVGILFAIGVDEPDAL
jgi:hypothetical protein